MGRRWVFQHENNPKHTLQQNFDWLYSHGATVLDFSIQSQDLNPIENLWKELKIKDP